MAEIETFLPHYYNKEKNQLTPLLFKNLTENIHRNSDSDKTLEDDIIEIEDKLDDLAAQVDNISGENSGDMLKSVYDTNGDGIVDKATILATARTINGVSFDGSVNRTNYGPCSTAAGTAAKTVALAGFTLATGSFVTIKFTYSNTAASPTLNINGTGAKNMYCKSTRIGSEMQCLIGGGVYTFVYDGTQYQLVSSDIGVTFSTTDLIPGSSSLASGQLYFVYE